MLPEDIDKLFRDRLEGHAPTPPAHLWTQLAEELQPTKKPAIRRLWALAAAIALLLVSGVLWVQLHSRSGARRSPLAASSSPGRPTDRIKQPDARPEKKPLVAATLQATPPTALASNPLKAASIVAVPGQPEVQRRQTRPTVAAATNRARQTNRPPLTTKALTAAPPTKSLAVASTSPSSTSPTPGAEAAPVLRPQSPIALAAAPTGMIEVEVVRNARVSAGASVAAEDRPHRSLGGILLRQARNVVRGEGVVLAGTTLPETVTVQARVGGRTLTKVIQL